MKRKLIISVTTVIILAVFGYNYVYHDHRDIKNENAEFVLSALEIFDQFLSDPINAEKKHLNKTIQITGVLTDLKTDNLTLSNNIFCQINDPALDGLETNSKIQIKGRFIGYDNLLEQLKLDQCTIIN